VAAGKCTRAVQGEGKSSYGRPARRPCGRSLAPVAMPEEVALPVHPAVAALAFLLGHWAGEGHGSYPGIEPFAYQEELTFTHTGKPFLVHCQQTWGLAGGRPLHCETGYWRAGPGERVEAVIAHPTGVAETEEGLLSGATIELQSRSVSYTSTAKEVSMLKRTIAVDGDVMTYTLAMSALGHRLQQHVTARLRRIGR